MSAPRDGSLPRISVVVPAYGDPAGLARCLAGLSRQEEPPFEVIVADDASPEDLSGTCRERGARHVRLPENRGPGEARNAGARAASGGILAFTDADCVPPPDWIRRIRANLAAGGTVAVAGTYGKELSGTFWGALRQAEARFHHLDDRAEVHSFVAANFAIRHDVLERAGGFPPLRIGEDLLLGDRLRRIGHAVQWDPGLAVDQSFRPTLRTYFRQQLAWSRGAVRIRLDHPETATMRWSVRRATLAPQIPLTAAFLACAAGGAVRPLLLLPAALAALAILALNAPFLVRAAVLRGLPFAAGAGLAIGWIRNPAWLAGASLALLRRKNGVPPRGFEPRSSG